MTHFLACRTLLEDATRTQTPSLTLQETLLAWPDYAVTAIVGGLALAARTRRMVTYSAGTPATPGAGLLPWPPVPLVSAPPAVAGLAAVPAASAQVVRVTSVPELDALIGRVAREHMAHGGANCAGVALLMEEAGRNALRWSVDRVAFIGWAWINDHIEVAVGDSGPGVPFVWQGFAGTNVLRTVLTDQHDERGRARHALTRLHEHLIGVPNREGYVVSGAETHECVTYVESFFVRPSLSSLGPTVLAVRL